MPYSQTMARASSVAFSMSFDAPVVMLPRKVSSAMRPPIKMEIRHGYNLFVVASGIQGRLINEVRQISASESRSAARDHANVDVFAQWNLARVNLQDAFSATHVGSRNNHATIETAGTKQRGIENVRAVSRSD